MWEDQPFWIFFNCLSWLWNVSTRHGCWHQIPWNFDNTLQWCNFMKQGRLFIWKSGPHTSRLLTTYETPRKSHIVIFGWTWTNKESLLHRSSLLIDLLGGLPGCFWNFCILFWDAMGVKGLLINGDTWIDWKWPIDFNYVSNIYIVIFPNVHCSKSKQGWIRELAKDRSSPDVDGIFQSWALWWVLAFETDALLLSHSNFGWSAAEIGQRRAFHFPSCRPADVTSP